MDGFELEPAKRERIRFGDYTNKARYLGVELNSKGTWGDHVEAKRKKTRKAWASIKPTFRYLSPRHRRLIWNGQLAAIALFASELTREEGADRMWKQTETLMNEVGRSITGAVRGTSNDLVREAGGLQSIAKKVQ